MSNKTKPPSLHDQRLVASLLTELMFCRDMVEVGEFCERVYNSYGLCDDPFTGCPCSEKDYVKQCEEYDKRTMIEKYGHCDGLD